MVEREREREREQSELVSTTGSLGLTHWVTTNSLDSFGRQQTYVDLSTRLSTSTGDATLAGPTVGIGSVGITGMVRGGDSIIGSNQKAQYLAVQIVGIVWPCRFSAGVHRRRW